MSKYSKFITIITVLSSIPGLIGLIRIIYLTTDQIFGLKIPIWISLSLLFTIFGLLILIYIKNKNYNELKVEKNVELKNESEFYSKINEVIKLCQKEVYIINLPINWVFQLIVTIFVARLRGLSINILYQGDFHQRYNLLEFLGCNVFRKETKKKKDIAGILIDPTDYFYSQAIILTPINEYGVYAKIYKASHDQFIINSVRAKILNIIEKSTEQENTSHQKYFRLRVTKVPIDKIFKKLSEVKFYQNCTFSYDEIQISKISPTTNEVVKHRFEQINDLIEIYMKNSWVLFKPVALRLRNKKESIIVPPIIEKHNNKYYLIEGHTRLYTLQKRNINKAYCIIVNGVQTELSTKPCRWKDVKIVEQRALFGDISLARHIERSCHSGAWETN